MDTYSHASKAAAWMATGRQLKGMTRLPTGWVNFDPYYNPGPHEDEDEPYDQQQQQQQ